MKMNVLERINAIRLCGNAQGNIIRLRIVQGMIAKIGLTEAEIKEFEIVEDPKAGKVTWGPKGFEEREIVLTEGEIAVLKDQLLRLDASEQLSQEHLSLYEKVVEGKKEGANGTT